MRNWRPGGRRGRRRRRRTAEVTGAYTRIGCCRRTMAAISISSGAARRSSNAPGLTAESAPPHTGGRNRLLRPPVLLPKMPGLYNGPTHRARSDGNQAPYMGLNCHLRRRPALFGATYTVPNTIPGTARFAFSSARLGLLCVRNTGSHASIARAPKAGEPALEHCRPAKKANLVGPTEAGGAAA